jgi:hypothetical protein
MNVIFLKKFKALLRGVHFTTLDDPSAAYGTQANGVNNSDELV